LAIIRFTSAAAFLAPLLQGIQPIVGGTFIFRLEQVFFAAFRAAN
jgi:hypothetical protein